MRILADQDVYKITIDKLTALGHDIVTAKSLDLQKASDEELLHTAKKVNGLLITRDKDFGELLFLSKKESAGVILLRGDFKNFEKGHDKLQRSLFTNSRQEAFRQARCP